MENLESGLISNNGSGAGCHPGPDAGAIGENGDKAIIAFRRVLLEKVQQLQSGETSRSVIGLGRIRCVRVDAGVGRLAGLL